MRVKRELLFLSGVLVIAALFVGIAAAGNDIDPRLVEVEKACTADEISIEEAWGHGTGARCAHAKANCRSNLAREIRDKAKAECNIYEKVSEQFYICDAVRGNFNPSKGTTYEPEECTKHEDGTYSVDCKLKGSVQYTCN